MLEIYIESLPVASRDALKTGNLIENLDKKQNAIVVEMDAIGCKVQLFSG